MTEQTKPEETTKTTTAPKPLAPSPASFAHKTRVVAQAPTISYSEEDIKSAKTFGRVDENGTVYVTENGAEREVGQYSTGTPEEALTFYIHRYLDSVSYTHLTLPTISCRCRSRWSPYH